MTGLVAADLRHRTGVFVGTFVAVLFGAALFSVCAGLFTSAIILGTESDDDYAGAIAVFATMGAISVFASLFVVASTVSLSVEQRRSDMALLRSVGATPRQVRRLVVREVAVVALVATAIGTALGVPAAHLLADVFARFDDLPDEFVHRWNAIPLLVTAATVWGAAFLSSLAASRAAGRASPTEAMTGADSATTGIGLLRWILGLLFVAGLVALVIVSATANDDPGLAIGYVFMASATGLIGIALLGRVVVGPAARLIGLPVRLFRIGSLAVDNAVADGHRTAATAAPVALMTAIDVGMVQASVAAADLDTEGTQLWSLGVMIAISVGFAAIAVVNTTAMTITRRRTQLASLRLAGATPRQVRRAAILESVIAVVAGTLLGLLVATAACWAFSTAIGTSLVGMIDLRLIGGLLFLALVLAVVTSSTAVSGVLRSPRLLALVD